MKSLFNNEPIKPLSLSFEQYVDAVRSSAVVSNETMSGFLYKIQDVLVSSFHSVTLKYNDKAASEVMAWEFQTLAKAKLLDFTVTSENLTSIPESFRGKYLTYLLSLKNTSKAAVPELLKLLDDFKIVIATFINDAAEDKIGNIYGIETFKQGEKNLEKHRVEVAKYFPANTGKSKGSYRDVLHTYGDFEHLFVEVERLDMTVNYDLIKQVNKEVENIRSMIDTLIKMTANGAIQMNNENLKKELVMATYVSGRYVEFISYLMTNIFTFYGVFKNNCDDFSKL